MLANQGKTLGVVLSRAKGAVVVANPVNVCNLNAASANPPARFSRGGLSPSKLFGTPTCHRVSAGVLGCVQ